MSFDKRIFSRSTQLILFSVLSFQFFSAGKADAAGNSYYLSTTGSDSNSGISAGNAWATLAHACQQLQAGDTLYVMPGIYADQHGVPAHSGTKNDPITVTAYSGRPEFSGTSGTAFDLNHYDYWTIENLYIHGYDGGINVRDNTGCHVIGNVISTVTWAAQFIDCSSGSLRNNTLAYGGWNTIQIDGTFAGTSNILIENNDVSHAVGHALLDLKGEFDHITVRNNVFRDTDQIAVYAHQTTHDGYTGEYLTIDSNTITNTGGGIQFEDPVHNVTISSNTITDLVDAMGSGGMYMRIYDGHGVPCTNVTVTGNTISGNATGSSPYMTIFLVDGLLFENNSLSRTSGGDDIRLIGGTGYVFRNTRTASAGYSLYDYTGAGFTTEYAAGRIFTCSGLTPRYYPDRSTVTKQVAGSSSGFTYYPACAVPVDGYLTITPNTINRTTDIWDLTVNSSVAENPTTFTLETLHPDSTYSVRRDNVEIATAYTDTAGKLVYTYSAAGGEFSSHNFKFVPTGQAAPLVYALTVGSGAGSGAYVQGTMADICANTAPPGKIFDRWAGDTASVSDIHAAVTTITIPAAPIGITALYRDISATAYTFTAPTPSSGPVNAASGNFIVTPNGLYTGTITITSSGGGLSAPITLTFSNSAAAQSFAITPAAPGTVTLTATNNGGLADPAAVTYTSYVPGTSHNASWNYPNPVNLTKTDRMTIAYTVADESAVTIRIYTLAGELVRTLVNDKTEAPGKYYLDWYGDNDGGDKVASGVYLYVAKIGNDVIRKKIVILR